MRYAISTVSALRNGKRGVITGQYIQGNTEHAFSAAYIRWFPTEKHAQRYIDLYLQVSEKAVILNEDEVSKVASTLFD